MSGNVHKDEVGAVKIPFLATSEDRGLSRCGTPAKVLATLTSTSRYKNDVTGIALIADTLTVELEDESGNLTNAPGIAVSFPYQSNASGFVIDWRQVTRNGGTEIATGCYRVKLTGNISGISFTYYYGAFDLDVWTMGNARYTVQVFSVLNDVVRKDGINYRDSGFANAIRFRGTFGYMQPNYQTTNLSYTDRTRKKVNNEALRTYELRTSYLVGCLTEAIDEHHLLAANSIWITEHNPLAHIQYIEFPVIVDMETSPSLEYPTGVYAKLTATFKDKVAVHQSKYDGDIAATENVTFNLPQGLACIGENANISVNGTFEGTTDTADVNVTLSDSSGTVTPDSITITGNTVAIDLAAPVASVVGAPLLKTGQTTSYRTGDDGDLQAGRDISFFTLNYTNPFGNTNRFTDELGGSAYTNNIVIDWSTYDGSEVLGYYRTLGGAVTWNDAIDNALALSVGTFTTGWRLANSNEANNIVNRSLGTLTMNYAPINNPNSIWTSTTYSPASSLAWNVSGAGVLNAGAKTATLRYLPVREFTVTGSTLT